MVEVDCACKMKVHGGRCWQDTHSGCDAVAAGRTSVRCSRRNIVASVRHQPAAATVCAHILVVCIIAGAGVCRQADIEMQQITFRVGGARCCSAGGAAAATLPSSCFYAAMLANDVFGGWSRQELRGVFSCFWHEQYVSMCSVCRLQMASEQTVGSRFVHVFY